MAKIGKSLNGRYLRERGRFARVVRRGGWVVAVCLVGVMVLGAAAPSSISREDLFQHLDGVIDWYRRVSAVDQASVTPEEVLFRDSLRQAAVQSLRRGFDFARAEVDLLAPPAAPASASQAGKSKGAATQNLAQAAAAASQRVDTVQAQLDAVGEQIKAAGANVPEQLSAQRDKLAAQLQLAKARNDVVQEFAGFINAPGTGSREQLLKQIDDLETSIPEARTDAQTGGLAKSATASSVNASAAATSSAAATQPPFHPRSLGVIGLISEMFSLSHQMSELKDLAGQADALHQAGDKLLGPIRTELTSAVHRGDALSATRPANDAQGLEADRVELESLTARFKVLAAAGLPLREHSDLLNAAHNDLLDWRSALSRQFNQCLRYLVIRVGGILISVVILLAISTLWRRATFRYITDSRRRQQFLLLRRIIIAALMTIVIVAGVVTEIGSLATYAGLLTAGIAVALQSVILSGAAYFFFIGRYGVRVGDRVTIAGITGDVLETGLFRLYLMELAGSGRDQNPTGRIVVFSNSVLLQPTPFYKQLPGAEYTWHEVAMTLSPDSDYSLAQERLLSAVQSVYSEYRETIERQHAAARAALQMPLPTPQPVGRLRFVDAGLEFVVRYPVEIRRAAEIDDKITRKLLETIEHEPKLRLVAPSTPKIQPANGQAA